MKFTRTLAKDIQEITEIFCNKCGMSCRGHVGNLNGLIEATVSGAYDSTHLEDGDVYTFSLCERCIKELIDSFQLYAKQGNYLFPEDNQPGPVLQDLVDKFGVATCPQCGKSDSLKFTDDKPSFQYCRDCGEIILKK
jgi:hypothetical protein